MRQVHLGLYCLCALLLAFITWLLEAGPIGDVVADEQLPAKAEVLDDIATSSESVPETTGPFCAVPDSFVGPEACGKCHQAEYQVWARTSHANNAYDLLRTSSNAKHYARNLGISEDQVSSATRCLGCHSAPQSETEDRTGVVHGVTCESCHNAAGGADGWLNLHSSYGHNLLRREDESAVHRIQRITRCRSKGLYRCDDLYSLAKRCYECHVVGDEELVVRGGHHPGNLGFEMTAWFDKQVRHNLFLNPYRNGLAPSLMMDPLWRPGHQPGSEIDHRRLMYVVSLLVDLEVSLRNRGSAKHASFARAAATRIAAGHSRLAAIAEHESAAVLLPVVDAVAELDPTLFLPPHREDSKAFLEAADLIADAAKRVSSAGNGRLFTGADQFLSFGSR